MTRPARPLAAKSLRIMIHNSVPGARPRRTHTLVYEWRAHRVQILRQPMLASPTTMLCHPASGEPSSPRSVIDRTSASQPRTRLVRTGRYGGLAMAYRWLRQELREELATRGNH
jgi:hypothetical protein